MFQSITKTIVQEYKIDEKKVETIYNGYESKRNYSKISRKSKEMKNIKLLVKKRF